MKRKPENCPTCNGWLWIEKFKKWLRYRETEGMICRTCGKDYSKKY